MSQSYQRIVLASRPTGWPTADNFRIETVPLEQPGDGQVLVKVHYLSLDPYMRGRMDDAKSYAKPQPLDRTMEGGGVGEVVASRHADFQVGDKVVGPLGWQEFALSSGKGLTRVDDSRVPLSAYLGAVGMPGMTAWYGYHKILAPKPGETLVVSAASGAVGSVVGQLARLHGVRAVGIAGGQEKCDYVVNELGFDACVDYKQASDAKALAAMLRQAAPDGIDCNFENVGGDILNCIISQLNPFARIAVCGLISDYNKSGDPASASVIQNPMMFLVARFTMQGFIVSDHADLWPQGLAELGQLVADGKLKYRETVAQGLPGAPEAFLGMLRGKNFGKQLVKL